MPKSLFLGYTIGVLVILLLLLLLPAPASASSPAYFPEAKNTPLLTNKGQSSALLSVPRNPNGKLILYLHPTTGIDDWCAPSLTPEPYFRDDGMRKQLGELIDRGYSILQPDYQGLGTPGVHPFFDLQANMPAISSALRESFAREERLGGDYLALGYSQGASLALEVAHQSALLPGVLRGSVAIAPASRIGMQIKMATLLDIPSPAAVLPIYLLRSYGYNNLLSDKARAVVRQSRGMCVLEFSALAVREKLSPKDVMIPGSWKEGARKQFLRDLRRAENRLPLAGKSLLVSGDWDRVVFPSLVQDLSERISKSGSHALYRKFEASHVALPFESWPFIKRWTEQSFDFQPARFYLPVREPR